MESVIFSPKATIDHPHAKSYSDKLVLFMQDTVAKLWKSADVTTPLGEPDDWYCRQFSLRVTKPVTSSADISCTPHCQHIPGLCARWRFDLEVNGEKIGYCDTVWMPHHPTTNAGLNPTPEGATDLEPFDFAPIPIEFNWDMLNPILCRSSDLDKAGWLKPASAAMLIAHAFHNGGDTPDGHWMGVEVENCAPIERRSLISFSQKEKESTWLHGLWSDDNGAICAKARSFWTELD